MDNLKENINAESIDKKLIISDIKCHKIIRTEITRILYQNSSDDSECMRIKFENIKKVIDEIMGVIM